MNNNNKKREAIAGLSFVAPNTIMVLCFSVVPIITCLILSFTKYSVLDSPSFIGIANYETIFRDTTVQAALRNTIVYVLVTVPLETIISVVLAAVIAGRFRNWFGRFVKAALFIPVLASPATVCALWKLLLSNIGPINMFLKDLGLPAINFLGSTKITIFVVCFICIWTTVGYLLIVLYAGIMDIPADHYSAADLDGATAIQKFWYITLPSLKAPLLFCVIMGTIWAFQEFDIVQIFTGGGPGTSTISLVVTVYRAAFKESRMGYACAISILLLICVLFFSAIQKALIKED